MEGKDNRSKDKRSKMKQHRKKPPQHNNTSSSSQVEAVRGVVDVADSSDERFTTRRGWSNSTPPQQQRRYSLDDAEDELNDAVTAQMHAGDFGLMAQLPTSAGGHFKFSSEKNWETAEGEQLLDNTEASEYFTLNLKLLNVGLRTIPFYKRMDYPASMFTREQLQSMEHAAEVAEKNYQNVLREHEANPRIKINSGSRKSGSGRSQNTVKPADTPSVANAPDELDELLSMTTAQVEKVHLTTGGSGGEVENVAPPAAPTPTAATVPNASKDDIQQWLDNVLDE